MSELLPKPLIGKVTVVLMELALIQLVWVTIDGILAADLLVLIPAMLFVLTSALVAGQFLGNRFVYVATILLALAYIFTAYPSLTRADKWYEWIGPGLIMATGFVIDVLISSSTTRPWIVRPKRARRGQVAR
ncbi:hypothetical protein [Cryptosporangium sp. NPDC051539]|uniref:hypothetical protein n=1 Tax=Cryptosporangium sp. NPDC051539 TaxID=3363962 RepID=UPI0037962414